MELDESELAHCTSPLPICIPRVIEKASGKEQGGGWDSRLS